MLFISSLLSITIAFLLTAPVSANSQTSDVLIKQASPQTIRYGKRTPVTIKLETDKPELLRPYLAAGGPYISPYLKSVLPENTRIILSSAIGDTLYLYTSDKQLLRIETNNTRTNPGKPVLTNTATIESGVDNIFTSPNAVWLSRGNNLIELDKHKLTFKNSIKTKNKIIDAAADSHNIYILNTKSAVDIFKRYKENTPTLIDTHKLTAPAMALAINNKTVFVATTSGIVPINSRSNKPPASKFTFTTSGSPNDIIINNKLAYIADGHKGLTVINIDNYQQMRLIGSYNKLGNVEKISLRGNRLITANTEGQLHLLDISNPIKPVVISSFNTHKKINDINFAGSHALVTHPDHQVSVNFITETMPPISTEGVTLGGSRRGQIVNNLMYVADWFSGLHIYDISNPNNIKHVSNYHTKGSSKGVLVHNGIAFVGDDDHGLQIIDVSDINNPQWISELATTGLAYTMKLIGTILYLADHRGGFHIIDVSNIQHPVRLGGIDTPGKAWAIDVFKGRAYVADDSTGLLVFDVTTPTKPRLTGQFNPGGFAEDIKIHNGIAYVAFFDKGLYLLNLDSPDKPKLISHLDIPGNARGIELDGNDEHYAYISSWYAGLQIVDIKNKQQPVITGHYDTDGATWGTVQNNDIIFALDWWEGIKSINIKNKQKPSYISRYQAKEAITDLAIKGNYIFTTNNHSGLQVHDIRNPLNPMWITGLDLPGSSSSISIANNHAFIQSSTKIIVVDINNPFRIKQIAEIKSNQAITDFHLTKNIAYISDSSNTITAFSLDSKNYLKKIPSISITDCQRFQIHKTLLTCSNSQKELFFYRINNNNQQPRLIIKQTTTSPISLLRISEKYIFLYSDTNKQLTILKNQDSFNTAFTTTLSKRPFEMRIYDDILYLSTGKNSLQTYMVNEDKLLETASYLANHDISTFMKNKDQIFFAGSHRLSSMDLLPKIRNVIIKNNKLYFDIPKDMPLGSYSLHLSHPTTGQHQFPNLFQVEFPKFRQPQFQ